MGCALVLNVKKGCLGEHLKHNVIPILYVFLFE